MIVLHYTEEANVEKALHTLRTRNSGGRVSAHFLIGKDGTIYQLVAEGKRAWQAGNSWWGITGDVNSRSIGIEIDNNGGEPYPQAQIDSLLRLLANITSHLHIPRTAIVAHADVAPTRRADPGVFFPWQELAEYGYGLWYDAGRLPDPPAGFNPMVALRLIGYDITAPTAAIIAWHRHFRATSAATFDARDLEILWNLEHKVMHEGLSRDHPDKLPPAQPLPASGPATSNKP
jgi:N-acetylmuramoyl-L-alanine amidase